MTNGQSQHSKNGRIAVLTANQPSERTSTNGMNVKSNSRFFLFCHPLISWELPSPSRLHLHIFWIQPITDSKIGITLRNELNEERVWQLKIPSGDYRIELEIESGSRHSMATFWISCPLFSKT